MARLLEVVIIDNSINFIEEDLALRLDTDVYTTSYILYLMEQKLQYNEQEY